MLIQVEGLSRLFKGNRGLRSVSFSINGPELVAVVGHNGAGKSTLLKLLAGWLIRDCGSVEVQGVSLDERRTLARRIGFVPETPNLFEPFTVEYNLRLFARLLGVPESRVADTLLEFQLQNYRSASVQSLSKGLKQRVSIGRALLADPQLLLFDEPTSGLDFEMTQEMCLLIRSFHAMGKTVLFSSHRQDEIRALAKRILVLCDGSLVFDGSTAEYFASTWQEKQSA
jgi:ABC-type multidrug transport system ATPase subunit